MKTKEANVLGQSDYFVFTPSVTARKLFYYPLYCGRFHYNADYHLNRQSYDSFLLMYIESGSMELQFEGQQTIATKGQFVLIDCYEKHAYRSLEAWSCIWLHFDGSNARKLYQAIVERHGHAFTLTNTQSATAKMELILRNLEDDYIIREALISKYIYDILTAFFLHPDDGQMLTATRTSQPSLTNLAEESMRYINDHYREQLTVEQLASRSGMSSYHYIRSFKRALGTTPYQYLIHTRLNAARYLLVNTQLSIKEICFSCGFLSESVFNNSFKKQHGLTPGQYRSSYTGTN